MLSTQWSKVFQRQPADIRKLRAALLFWMAVAFHCPHLLLAGHDLMVHLAIYNDGPFETDQAPAVFGVPLPSSDDPVDPEELILVGADTWQIKPLSHWPNGSIRWMLVEAIVNVQPNQDRAAFHLTTGQAPEEQPPIASETSDGFVLDTGNCRIRIGGTESVVCQISPIDDTTGQLRAIRLNHGENNLGKLQKRTLTLENNGPVTATIALIETYEHAESKLTYTRRCRAIKNRSGLIIESTLLCQPGGWRNISLQFPPLMPSSSADGLLEIRTHDISQSLAEEVFQMTPGSMRRMWHTITLPSTEESSHPPLRPFLGRAISINTYNDALCTEAYIRAGTGDASLDLQENFFSRTKATQYISDIMGGSLLPSPQNYRRLSEWMENWTPEINTSQLSGTPDKGTLMDSLEYDDAWRIPSLWYFMTGDTIFKNLRINDAHHQTEAQFDLRQYHRLWDAYLLNDSLDLRNSVADQLATWFDNATDLETIQKNRQLFRMVSNLIHQGGFEQEEQDIWLDRMESLVHHDRNSYLELNDILFADAYRITGDNRYLKEGQEWLKQKNAAPEKNNALTGLIQNIQRQHIWRWLEPTVEDRGKEGWELSWKVPRNAVRYRFKQSDRKIINVPETSSSAETIAFYAADNLELDIASTSPGIRQTIVVHKSKTGDNTHFAMRYLERGSDLPALKTPQGNGIAPPTPAPSSSTSPKTYADFLMIGLLVVGLGLAFIAWKMFI